MCTTRNTAPPWRSRAATRSMPCSRRTTGFQVPEGCHWGDVRTVTTNVGQALQTRAARHRARQPRHALRHLRRRPVDQQGAPLRCPAARPDRALFRGSPSATPRGRGRSPGTGVRVPDQEVRRRHQQEGRRVLHPALRRAADGEHPGPAGGRDHLRPRLRHRRHAAGGDPPREREARRRSHPVGQALRPGEEPHHLGHRADEPLSARRRRFPDRARRHPAPARLLTAATSWPPSIA